MSDDGERQSTAAVHNDMSGTVHGPVVQAYSVGQVVFHGDRPSHPVPSQLPSAPRSFTNRGRELGELERWLSEANGQPLLVVVSGSAGVGKTALALHWLHDVRDQFPDGQLYVDLGAFSQTGAVDPADVLEWFLLALGTSAKEIPVDIRQREASYRTMIANRAVAILLDNAFSAAQVRPLLTVSPRSVVIVTSRWRLAGLHVDGARFLYADPMTVADSVKLLNDLVGDERLSEQHAEVEELARLCGGLPIALSMVGARLAARPHRTLSREVGELRRDRLATLSLDDEATVEVIFDLSYDDLPAEQARIYRLCSLHSEPVFGVEVAAAMTETSVEGAEDTLDALAQRNMLTEVDDRRFRYHDLLFEHARQQAARSHEEPDRHAVARRMVEWYLNTTVAADVVLRPTRRRIGPRFRRPPDRSSLFRSGREALGWLSCERRNIVQALRTANEHRWDPLVWEFCEALWSFYLHSRSYRDWLEIHEYGIPAAQRCANSGAEAQLRNQLGQALANLRRYDDAVRESSVALRLAKQDSDQFLEASSLSVLAEIAQGQGNFTSALRYLRHAKEIREVIGTARALALCQQRIGGILADMGRYAEATAELRQAADAMATLDRSQYARTLTSLGSAYLRWGHFQDAEGPLAEALAITTELGSPFYRAGVLVVLGDLAKSTGDVVAARRHYRDAHQTYAAEGDPRATELANRLADLT